MVLSDASSVAGRIGSLIQEPGLISGIVLIVVGLIVTFLTGRRRVLWQDQLNVAISITPKQAKRQGTPITWKISKDHTPLEGPSLTVLRVRNAGFSRVGKADFESPLTFVFPGRKVEWFEPTEYSTPALKDMVEAAAAAEGSKFELKNLSLNRGQQFSLFILLSKATGGKAVSETPRSAKATGKWKLFQRRDRTQNVTRRGKPPAYKISGWSQIKGGGPSGGVLYERPRRGPATRTLAMIGIIVGIAFALAGSIIGAALRSDTSTNTASSCFTGKLLIEGSTAFAPEAGQIKQTYIALCRDAQISINALGTYAGLQDLHNFSKDHPSAAASRVTMSDGVVNPSSYPGLKSNPVGIIVFSVIINKVARVSHLTLPQLRDIYQGKYTNWSKVGGASLPIVFVGRGTSSGTARTFDSKLLGPISEPPVSSDNCRTRDVIPDAKVVSCPATDTAAMLQNVENNTGAIGYAQTTQVSNYPNVQRVALDGMAAGLKNVENGHYPFWAVESLYTYRSPAHGTPAAAFTHYMTGPAARDIAASQGYTPCADLPTDFRIAHCG